MSTQDVPAPNASASEDSDKPMVAPESGTDANHEAEGSEAAEGGTSSEGGGEKDSSTEASRLREELARIQDENLRYAAIVESIDSSPYASKVAAYLNGVSAEPEDDAKDDGVMSYVEKHVPRTIRGEDGEVPNPNREFIAGLVEEIRKDVLKQVRSEVSPQLQTVQRTLNGSRFERALSDKGFDPSAQRSPEFRSFVKELERDPGTGKTFREMREKRPEAAARWLAAELQSRNGVRAANARERERNGLAKQASSLAGAGQRGAATSVREFVYNPRDPQNLHKLEEFLRKAPDPVAARKAIVRKK